MYSQIFKFIVAKGIVLTTNLNNNCFKKLMGVLGNHVVEVLLTSECFN